jgi:6-pyruvoyltetrahydropterin/6-carboxytetrahydropterin synthase
MYEVSKVVWFCAAHQVRFDGGECERLHGHNWRVRVTVRARELDRIGYVIDFAELKRATWLAVERFDHGNLNELPPFDVVNPTAENLARHVHGELAARFNDDRRHVHRVEIWETENNRAAFLEDAPTGA